MTPNEQIAAWRIDAERYRWLRDTGRLYLGPVIGRDHKCRCIIASSTLGSAPEGTQTLGEAIDYAMGKP